MHITTFQICTGHLLFLEASLTSELISLPRWSLYLIPGIEPNMINEVEIVEYLWDTVHVIILNENNQDKKQESKQDYWDFSQFLSA